MRAHFNFANSYRPLNHGSFGTFPRAVQEFRFGVLRAWEERECISQVFDYPPRLKECRALIAPLLGADTDEVVFVPNATTGVNTVLRNLVYQEGDIIIYPETIYSSCRGTVESLEETTPVRGHKIEVLYPIEDDDLVDAFRTAAKQLIGEGYRIRVAVFDTIISAPGIRVPWERIVESCRELGILSLIDGAHGIGHIDLTHVGTVKPDFLVSNCHKWLYVPRGCAALYVPFANQHLITTAFPTSHGYQPPNVRRSIPTSKYFTELFAYGATVDVSTYLTVPASLRFRQQRCGGEAAIREYCTRLAREGGDMVALALGTEVLDNESGSLRQGCAFANVRMPVPVGGEEGPSSAADMDKVIGWIRTVANKEFDTYLQPFFYRGALWTRLSAQVYLDTADFEWAAQTLVAISSRLRSGEWKGSFGV
ncbi:aminotransferase family protein-like protein [Cercophora newfieldiana]|uniref:Aminotransferase family protein-like protein n=1 Tax=Cercophora newfieldiana TaxID=92897 RepID=A0AA39Y8Z8_9PEZI|nr:aminotransferase family protein-like protein [Cercophora newfieldiana]